jgi:ABC-2 type transport system ATP-binding protein
MTTKNVKGSRGRKPVTAPAIAVRRLTKSYGGRKVVDDLSFEVGWGRVVAFLGPNGAGKTTTLKLILGLAEPTSGTAEIVGSRYADLASPTQVVGAVLDNPTFHPKMTGRRHLKLIAEAISAPPHRVDDALRVVKLDDAADRHAGDYSLGMRRRLALAAALIGAPRVLVLDEPANGLDPAGIRWLRGALRNYTERGNAVLISSHVLSEVAELADDVVVIDRGRLLASEPIADLIEPGTDLEGAFFELMNGKEA